MAAMAILPELAYGSILRLEQPLRIGVIGIGRQGRSILAEALKIEGLEILAICDTDESRRNSGQRRVRGAKGYADPNEVLSQSDIDAVFIATPTHTHRAIAQAAIDAGKHVYCEAPMAHTIEDCQALAEAARKSDKVFHVGLLGRVNPVYTLAYSFMRSGSIRDFVSARAQYHKKTSWRVPAGDPMREKALNWKLDPGISLGLAGEQASHQMDVVNWFANQYPLSVRGAGSIQMWDDGRELADSISLEFEYPGGQRFLYDATLANSYEGEYEQICGTMGTIKLAWSHGWLFKEADAPTQGWEVYANRQQFHNDEGITLIADATQLAAQGKLKEGVGLQQPSLYYGVESFVKSVVEEERVRCPADVGMRAAIIGILAHQAVVSGETVAIPEELLRAG